MVSREEFNALRVGSFVVLRDVFDSHNNERFANMEVEIETISTRLQAFIGKTQSDSAVFNRNDIDHVIYDNDINAKVDAAGIGSLLDVL